MTTLLGLVLMFLGPTALVFAGLLVGIRLQRKPKRPAANFYAPHRHPALTAAFLNSATRLAGARSDCKQTQPATTERQYEQRQ